MKKGLDKWIEVDIEAVKHNLSQVRANLDERVRLIAVLKADAYGHGARDTARLLYQQGVEFFAVTFLYEALQLRSAGIRSNILLFAPLVTEEQIIEAVDNHLTITIASLNDMELLLSSVELSRKLVSVHIKIESGLGRFGFNEEEALQVCRELNQISNIYLEGIYTHMADAAGHTSYTDLQFQRFVKVIETLEREGFHIPVRHCANSAVFLKHPHMHMDAVRIGTLLSGQHPVGDFSKMLDLKDPYKFKSRIISLRSMEKGSYLGYYRTYRLKKNAQIGIIPVGFNDGLGLEVANPPSGFLDLLKVMARQVLVYFNWPRFTLKVCIRGREYPLRGKVFMQMALVEIPPDVVVHVGDEVELPVRKTLAAKNIARIYVKDGIAGKVAHPESTTYIVEEG